MTRVGTDEELAAMYAEEGVRYYILVYPSDFKAKIYRLEDGKYTKVGDFLSERAKLEGRCDVEIDFASVFRKLKKLRNALH